MSFFVSCLFLMMISSSRTNSIGAEVSRKMRYPRVLRPHQPPFFCCCFPHKNRGGRRRVIRQLPLKDSDKTVADSIPFQANTHMARRENKETDLLSIKNLTIRNLNMGAESAASVTCTNYLYIIVSL